MSDPERSHSVVEHHRRDPGNEYTGSDETIHSQLTLSEANTKAEELRRAGRKVSVFHDEKCIDLDPSLRPELIGVYARADGSRLRADEDSPRRDDLRDSFEGFVTEVDGSALLLYEGPTPGSKKNLDRVLSDLPVGQGWAGRVFDIQVGLPPGTVRFYKGCTVVAPEAEGFRIAYDSSRTK